MRRRKLKVRMNGRAISVALKVAQTQQQDMKE